MTKFTINAASLQGNRLQPAKQYTRVLVGKTYMTYAQIGEAIGLTPTQVRHRYKVVKAKVWPLTIEDLRRQA